METDKSQKEKIENKQDVKKPLINTEESFPVPF